MVQNKPRHIRMAIYPNQLKWIDFISEEFKQSRRQTLLECVACYIGEIKQATRKESLENENKKAWVV